MAKLFVAQPLYGRCVDPAARDAYWLATTQPCLRGCVITSLLGRAFNQLWAQALCCRQTDGVTHFAMIHGDVGAEHGWAEKLVAELERVGGAAISAVVPIKDTTGDVSLALADPSSPYKRTRVSLETVAALPATFCGEDISPGRSLLINTGCMVVDLRRPWVHEVTDAGELAVVWHVRDRIRLEPDPENGGHAAVVEVEPEDWRFSRLLAERGEVCWATRKVAVRHYGAGCWDNSRVYARGEAMSEQIERATLPTAKPLDRAALERERAEFRAQQKAARERAAKENASREASDQGNELA